MPATRVLRSRLVRYGVVGGFAAWMAMAIAGQHPNTNFHRFRRYDPLTLIPDFRFFGPNPGQHDLHLLVRCRMSDESTTGWAEVERYSSRPKSYLIWNPDQRRRKALTDVILRLTGILGSQSLRAQKDLDSEASFELAHAAVGYAVELYSDVVSVQYLVGQSAGFDESEEPEFLYVSRWYDVTPAGVLG